MTIITIDNENTGNMTISTDYERFKGYLMDSINFSKLDMKTNVASAKGFNVPQGCDFLQRISKFYKEGC